tara:strand:- start:893 stop:1330 length:438 start_codon:yes stop_codon:yes gene_type:complete
VESKELSNLYLDLAKEILQRVTFDQSSEDSNEQLLFLVCVENSMSYLADDIFNIFQHELDSIKKLNLKFKWTELSKAFALKNIILRELGPEGLINYIEISKSLIHKEEDQNLITRSDKNNLKKFTLILNKYKAFKELLRKVLDEC